MTRAAKGNGFFGHPTGLSTLFFTEMWERFSYFGMRAILALYLFTAVSEGGLGMDEGTATSLVLSYMASVYLTSVVGGWLADRVLGPQRAIFYGGVLIMLGHLCMAIPAGYAALAAGLTLIVLGSGLMKPNVPCVVGGLYADEDARRDAGFTIFYMSINIGAFAGQLIVGFLQPAAGFHWAFGAAAVGMALGLTQYVLGGARLGSVGKAPINPLPAHLRSRVITRVILVTAGIVVLLGVTAAAWGLGGLINTITGVSMVLPVCYFAVMFRSRQITRIERDRLIAYVPLFLATAVFFLLFEQQSATLVRVLTFGTDRMVFGFEIPIAWFQAINAVAIIVMAPLFALLWARLGSRQPSTATKFAGGLVFVAIGLLWVVVCGLFTTAEGLIQPLPMAFVFVLLTIGELMLSPVGVSVTTKLAPRAFASQMLGLYYLALALGQGVGAQVVKLYTPERQGLFFGGLGLATLVVSGMLVAGAPWIRKYMRGVV